MSEPEFDDFKESGDCPNCGDEEPGLFYASCCGRQFCWDCYWIKHEKYEIPAATHPKGDKNEDA